MTGLELWGGIECTVNRVGDRYADQCRYTGHHDHASDLDLFAGLGLSALRYPVLWERIAPERPDLCDWSWTDARLGRLRDLGVRPIAGLVHHGSGPRHTNLLDPDFAAKLGDFAGRLAERYNCIDDWTPVNEPLTTARFSALYGHWYPHHADERSFWIALLNQVDGTRLAMRAIRRVNPAARLIQTDDLGYSYATPPLTDQAAFDNDRRWVGWDLLFGRVVPGHMFWQRLAAFGLSARLDAIADDPCPPDIIGVNHYLTSDRFLDHRLDRYPPHTHGGNGTAKYADVEAIRVLDPPPSGLAGALQQAWARYGVPLALTEIHNGCTREEQLRWAAEAWDTAVALRAQGVDVRAVTAWALLGSQGWNTLLTAPGVYEPGVFDVRGGEPRATALAELWRGLPHADTRHPVAAAPGWWRRPVRLSYPAVCQPLEASGVAFGDAPTDPRPILITGATGTLGQAFAHACDHRGLTYILTSRSMLDLESAESIPAALDAYAPWAVINATGWVRVDDAEDDPDGCFRANTHGALAMAKACDGRGIPCVQFSSDLVFDGTAGRAYHESDLPTPLGVYGRSKTEMERGCLALSGAHLIVRTAGFFSPDDPHNFAAEVVRTLSLGHVFHAADDQIVSPTFVPHLVDVVLDLTVDGETGFRHLTNGEAVSWSDFALRIADACGLRRELVQGVSGQALGWRAKRPLTCGLESRSGMMLPPLQDAIGHFARAIVGVSAPAPLRASVPLLAILHPVVSRDCAHCRTTVIH